MADTSPSALLETAREAARRAGRILADRFQSERTIEFKSNTNDLVTDADKAAEAELLGFLRGRYPDHAVLAEESGLTRGSQLRWIVDPLDGTTNYAHRVPHFCVSVAVEGPDGVLAGAIYDPLRDELFSGARGQGATLNGVPLSASPVTVLERAVLCTGFPYDVRERPEAPLGLFNRLVPRAQGVRRMGSAALDLAYVAAGRFDGFFEFGLKPWDIAAGALLVWEAGGRMTQVDGAPLDLRVGDVLASAPGIFVDLQSECGRFLSEMGWKPRPFSLPKQRLGEQFGKVGYERSLVGMELLEAADGRAKVRLPVAEPVQNVNGALHGGAVATLVDYVGTLAILTADRQGRPGVSTDLNVSWFSPAPSGSAVLIEAAVLKIGRTLGFVTVDIRREGDGVLVAQGRMTKFLG